MRIQFKAGEACVWLPRMLCALGMGGNTVFCKPDPGSPTYVFISAFSTWEAGVWQGSEAGNLWGQAAWGSRPPFLLRPGIPG